MSTPKLLALVEVEKSERVYCAQPGCNHTVYKAIHIVRDGGQLLTLGSSCFAKRFGGLNALGKAQHWGGSGKLLTPEERALLRENTEALLTLFAHEEALLIAAAERRLQELQARMAKPVAPTQVPLRPAPVMAPCKASPWNWVKPLSSVAAFKLKDETGWVRAQHRDGRQFVMPWPIFDGWDEVWPPSFGVANQAIGGYEVLNVVEAIAYLRAKATAEKITGRWHEVVALLGMSQANQA